MANQVRRGRGGRTLGALILATVLGVAGCGVRLDGPPPELPSPDAAESARQGAAERAEETAVIAGAARGAGTESDELVRVEAQARAHLAALGDVWRPPAWATASEPGPTPSVEPGGPVPSAEEVAARLRLSAVATCRDAVALEPGDLVTLLASICLAQRGTAQQLGEEVPELAGTSGSDAARAEALGAALGTSGDAVTLAGALDAAGFALEVAAARSSGDRRARLADRAHAHRDTARVLLEAAETIGSDDDPRRAAYSLEGGPPDPAEVETEVLAAWAAVVGSVPAAHRGVVLGEMATAAEAAAAWGAPTVAFPGLSDPTQP